MAGRTAVSAEAWRYGLVGGLLAVPFTTASYWQTGSELSLSPVLLGGVVAGYLAKRATGTARGVGIRTGLIGGLPTLWMLADIVVSSSALTGAWWFVGAGVGLVALFVLAVGVMGFGFAALVGELGAHIGGWLANSTSGQQPPTARS